MPNSLTSNQKQIKWQLRLYNSIPDHTLTAWWIPMCLGEEVSRLLSGLVLSNHPLIQTVKSTILETDLNHSCTTSYLLCVTRIDFLPLIKRIPHSFPHFKHTCLVAYSMPLLPCPYCRPLALLCDCKHTNGHTLFAKSGEKRGGRGKREL